MCKANERIEAWIIAGKMCNQIEGHAEVSILLQARISSDHQFSFKTEGLICVATDEHTDTRTYGQTDRPNSIPLLMPIQYIYTSCLPMYVASFWPKLMYSQQRYKIKREKERKRKEAGKNKSHSWAAFNCNCGSLIKAVKSRAKIN